MNTIWRNNNSLNYRFIEGKNTVTTECTFKEFINSPFFDDFDKPVEDNKWLFGNGSDKMLVFDEEEMYDSWTMVSLYLNDSKKPTATLLADNIQSVKLTLNLGNGSTYLEIFSSEVPESLERRLTRSGYILFNLSEEMIQALKNNYNDYYEDYFPDLNKPYENLEENRIKESNNIPSETKIPPITKLLADDMKEGLNNYRRYYTGYANQLLRCELVPPERWWKANVAFAFNNSFVELTSLLNAATDILRSWGAKYIGRRYNYVYGRLDLEEYENRAKEIKKQADAKRNAAIDAIDISMYKPSQGIMNKLRDYRSRGSKVNVNAIKDPVKYLTYYYGACLMDWKDLKFTIELSNRFSWEYRDELLAIDKKVKPE